MPAQGYRPSIRRLQEDFARRLARKRLVERIRAQRGGEDPKTITDNSEPWMVEQNSMADDWFVACQVAKDVERWGPQVTSSSAA